LAPRVIFELILFLLPFILFGVYRIAVTEAEQDGRKPWPIRWLFGIGAALAVGVWIVMILMNRGGRDECYTATRMVDGVMVEGEKYACDKDLSGIGTPKTDDPGGVAPGVGGLSPEKSDDTPPDE